jgi:dynein heavy chain
MSELERQMIGGVRQAFLYGMETYETTPRTDWVKVHAGQIVLNASQIFWTKDVEKHMIANGLNGVKTYYQFLVEQRKDTVRLV